MFRIKTMNKISPLGLEIFPKDRYEIGSDVSNPDAILVRSADLHGAELPDSVLAIARAGAGVNNIPIGKCSDRGVVVFNTPGGNANAVKELAIASLLLASRNIVGGINWATSIVGEGSRVPELVEKEKSKFDGPELRGKTLGVLGLGAIGVMIANDALAMGMNVVGFDPFVTIDSAWNLSRSVVRAESLDSLLSKADYLTLHVPLSDATKGLLNAEKFKLMKDGARIVNLSRGALVNDADVVQALNSGKLSAYVTDFPNAELLSCKNAICVPHLGASTPEAEDNCAIMASRQLMDFLETGAILNSVNFPRCRLERRAPHRLLVASRAAPDMVARITELLASASVVDLASHNCGDYAYSVVDTEREIPGDVLGRLGQADGIIRLRRIGENEKSQTTFLGKLKGLFSSGKEKK